MRIGVLESGDGTQLVLPWRAECDRVDELGQLGRVYWVEQIAHPMRVLAWPVIFDSVNNAIVSLPCAVGVRGIAVKCGHRYA